MSTIKALVPYQIETFRSGPAQAAGPNRNTGGHSGSGEPPRPGIRREPTRSPAFLVQLMVGLEADLRKSLGRSDIAHARQSAYGSALANRPSVAPAATMSEQGRA